MLRIGIGSVLGSGSLTLVRCRRERKVQRSPLHQLVVCDIAVLTLVSIQRYAREVFILFRLVCRDRKYLSVSEFHGRFVKERRSQDKLVATRTYGVDAEAAKDIL